MTDEEILSVLDGLKALWWNHNYGQFCELMGWPEDYYSEEKWTALSTISQGLGQFDNDRLVRIVRTGWLRG